MRSIRLLVLVAAAGCLTSPPPELEVTATSPSSVRLRWTLVEPDAQGYRVERATTSQGGFDGAGTVGANVFEHADVGLVPATLYFYRLRPLTAGVPVSTPVQVVTPSTRVAPSAPAGLSAVALDGSTIRLAWVDLANNETGFEFERAAREAGPFAPLRSLPPDTTMVDDPGLTPATTWWYRVRATNAGGESGWSNVAVATTPRVGAPPSAPTGLGATPTTVSSVLRLTWTDTAENEAGYHVERASAQGGPFARLATLGPDATEYLNERLAPTTTHWYRVQAFNGGGVSAFSNVAGATTRGLAPKPPSSVAATAASGTQVRLTWVDTSDDETGFEVVRSRGNGAPWAQAASLAANVNEYDDSRLMPATTYWYRVRSINAAGPSEFSPLASAETFVQHCTPAQTRCIAGAIDLIETCDTQGLAWGRSGCPWLQLCTREACRPACDLAQTPLVPTVCVVPNADGVNDGTWSLWTDHRLSSGWVSGGAGGRVLLDRSSPWPYVWTIDGKENVWLRFRLDPFGAGLPPTISLTWRAKGAGWLIDTQNQFTFSALARETVIARSRLHAVPSDYGTFSAILWGAQSKQYDFSGGWNVNRLGVIGDDPRGVDGLRVNWLMLQVE